VLDGLLENNTILRLREHYTDTHGFTEHVFGLCYLLGYSFMPRLRDLADQHLYKMDRQADHGCLNPLFHGVADTHLLREQWDSLVRVAASLKNRTAPANVIVQRLANASSSDRLAGALTALGRIVKTIFVLRYLSDPELRSFGRQAAPPTVKQHMAAIRMLFSWLTEKGVLAMNPAREVKTERFSRTDGKTPAFVEGEVGVPLSSEPKRTLSPFLNGIGRDSPSLT
jgi:hypothetical protein